jgi:hypothetical protein
MQTELFKESQWDSDVFRIDCFEIVSKSEDALKTAATVPGHYTFKADPLVSTRCLQKYGFYYCDTLIEPYCTVKTFKGAHDENAFVSKEVALVSLLEICQNSFIHGRFHRDFNIQNSLADKRYSNWLEQLYNNGKVYGLYYEQEIAGFIAVQNNILILHAMSKRFRGLGRSKYLWTPVCKILFDEGYKEVLSSVSATNMSVINLYISLGFKFRNPKDVYHRLTP